MDNSLLGVTSETTPSGTTYYGRMPDGMLIDERKGRCSRFPITNLFMLFAWQAECSKIVCGGLLAASSNSRDAVARSN